MSLFFFKHETLTQFTNSIHSMKNINYIPNYTRQDIFFLRATYISCELRQIKYKRNQKLNYHPWYNSSIGMISDIETNCY